MDCIRERDTELKNVRGVRKTGYFWKNPFPGRGRDQIRLGKNSEGVLESSQAFPSPLGSLGLFLLFLNAWLIIKTPFLNFRKKAFFGQLPFEIFDRLFYLVVTNNDFHICISPHIPY